MTDLLEPIRRALKGRYHVERLLGEGGMAIVYLARDERHHRQVAVKILRPELAQSVGVGRFGREIEIAARLNHPNILPLLDSGVLELGPGWPPATYYVMPYVEGESLRDRLVRDGRLPLGEALRLTGEIADALDHAHRHGVIHRDIKPENVLLSENHAVVADFGIARALDEAAGSISRTGQAIGTPAYMSPEQITGERTIDGRTDIYALGCTLYEMLGGKAPWGGLTVSAALAKRLAGPAPRIRSLDPTVPAAVDEALARALELEPEKRFATSAEFAAALVQAAAPPPAAGSTPRRLVVRAAAVVVVVLALGFGLIRLARPGHADAITSLAIAPEPGDSATAYFSEGVLDAVANLLRRIPQLRLTAPSLVAQLRRQQPTMTTEELGQRLKVGAILSWSLRHSGDSVQLSAELYRVPGGALVWNARFGRSFAEVASIQGEVARMVADSLRLQLTGSAYASMVRRPTASAAAYDVFLRARRFELRGLPLGAADARQMMDSAAHYAREAIALDSSFALARGLLGTYYFVTAFRGWGAFTEYIDSASVASERALAVDSTLGDPWINKLSQAIYLDDDWNAAEASVSKGLRLSAHDAQVLLFSAIVVGEVEGRFDSAFVLARRASEMEPSTQYLNTLGDLYMRVGRYDSAASALRRALEIDPSVPGPRRRLIQSLERLKRFDEAITTRRQGGDTTGAAAYAQGFREGGEAGYERVRRQDLERQLAPLLAPISRPYKLPDDTVPQLREERIVALYAQLGEWTQAMDWVLKLKERRPRRFRLIVTNPFYNGLRNDPRFLPLVKSEGLEGLLPRRP